MANSFAGDMTWADADRGTSAYREPSAEDWVQEQLQNGMEPGVLADVLHNRVRATEHAIVQIDAEIEDLRGDREIERRERDYARAAWRALYPDGEEM